MEGFGDCGEVFYSGSQSRQPIHGTAQTVGSAPLPTLLVEPTLLLEQGYLQHSKCYWVGRTGKGNRINNFLQMRLSLHPASRGIPKNCQQGRAKAQNKFPTTGTNFFI